MIEQKAIIMTELSLEDMLLFVPYIQSIARKYTREGTVYEGRFVPPYKRGDVGHIISTHAVRKKLGTSVQFSLGILCDGIILGGESCTYRKKENGKILVEGNELVKGSYDLISQQYQQERARDDLATTASLFVERELSDIKAYEKACHTKG